MVTKKNIKSAILVFGVIIIPLLYSYFYLGAFWDPYNTLKDLPVAVVNEDTGATINGKNRNIGSEVVKELKDSGKLKFMTTDAANASTGVKGSKYYASITIPSNFSSNIASAETTVKKNATIYYQVNQKRNYIASQILGKVTQQIEENVRGNVSREITNQLTVKLNEVPSQLTTLSNGLGQIQDGTNQLASGTKTLADGQTTLTANLKTLDSGVDTMKTGSTTLTDGLGTLDSGLGQAYSGSKQLSSALSGNDSISRLTGAFSQLNAGAQKLSASLAANSQYYTGMQALSSGLNQLSGQFSASSSELSGGMKSAASGAHTLSESTGTYVSSVNQTLYTMITTNPTASEALLTTYQTELKTVTDLYVKATDATQKAQYYAQLQMLANLITMYSVGLQSSSEAAFETTLTQLAASDATKATVISGGSQLESGVSAFANKAAPLSTAADQIQNASDALVKLASASNSLMDGTTKLQSGAKQLADGTQQLAANSGSLNILVNSVNQLTAALSQLKGGSSALYTGSAQLQSALTQAKSGTAQMVSGSQKLTDGAKSANSGASQLSNGVSTAKSTVDSKVSDAKTELEKTKGLDTYTQKSVSISEKDINPIKNYGTAFAPYFMSLSLWVGALLVFFGIYLDADERIKLLSRHSPNKLARVAAFILIGIAQALALALIVHFLLGLPIANMAAFYLSCILVSIVFISIVEFFIVNLKDVGKFLAMLALILQLTSNGGTFPMETVPKFFNALYPYMPMTYSVRLFKEAITNYNSSGASSDVTVLISVFLVFTLLNVLFSLTRKAKVKIRKNRDAQET